MAKYRYKAKNLQGKVIYGTLEAENDAEFYKSMENQQLYCINMNVRRDKMPGEGGSRKKLGTKAVSVFCRELSVLLASGMNLLASLQLLYEREEKPFIKNSYMLMIEGIEKGETFYEVIRKQGNTYPNLLKSMVLAGEASGTMDLIMEKMALYYEKETNLRSKTQNAMMYPMLLLAVTFGVIILLFVFVLPKFFEMFEGQEVPGITKVFMAASQFLMDHWLVLLLGAILFACIVKLLAEMERPGTKMDEMILSIPVFGKLIAKIIMGHFANAMSILYASGITIVKSLEISAGTVDNRYIAGKLVHVREKVEKGVALSQALQSEGLFDRMFWSMVHIGEESGNLEMMFFKLSEYLEQESEAAVQKMMAALEPMILIVIALVVGMVVASVMVPMYSMNMM